MDGLAATPQDRPWFVDYFHDLAAGETPGDAIMEYDHRYAYKLAAYRDIESNGAKVPLLLFSVFTDFSSPILPGIPTLAVSPLSAPYSPSTGGVLPTLRFLNRSD